jgi:hypothetical protein
MDIKRELMSRHRPLVLTTQSYRTDELCGPVAEAVNFVRACEASVQILVSLSTGCIGRDEEGLKKNARLILDSLEAKGENLRIESVRLDDLVVKLTVHFVR